MKTNDSKDQGREAFETTLLEIYATLRELADANAARRDPVEAMVNARAQVRKALATSASALARDEASAAKGRDVKQLADWLLTDPQTGEPLHFAGPLERDFLRMSRVKMESKSGGVWTLTAGLKEGYLTAAERMSNLEQVAAEERQAAREPSIEQLNEMAYLLALVPRGEVVCVQFLDVLRRQYRAAMEASGV
jgi:hypothetical protein